MSEATTKMVLKDCGKHYGSEPGKCSKCAYFASPEYNTPKRRAGRQYGGAPWIAVLEQPDTIETPRWDLSGR